MSCYMLWIKMLKISLSPTQGVIVHIRLNQATRSAPSPSSFYNDASQYMKIFEANKNLLSSPDKIAPGQVLTIPE